ncbi:MAG: dapF [Acidimicrobiaceae bacterium]|nr:dapF [Acidimicrobiaceae bacterium]
MTFRSLQKWHGAGNDFLIDVQQPGYAEWWTPSRVRAICHRTTGVGADGVLVAALESPVSMTLFNADGSIAEMSGNGIRCLAAAVRRFTSASFDHLDVATLAGRRTVSLQMHGTSGYASVAMGEVTMGEPLEGTLGVANVGNPHVVVLDRVEWNRSAREEVAEKLRAQVGGANVEFLTVLGEDHLSIRVIERGVGWTQACGTGTCAVAMIAREAGLSSSEVMVENPGGPLRVVLSGSHATLSGPVEFIADVEWLAA